MRRYGTNADGQMERDSVARMLQDLNGGEAPATADVDWVMAEAHALPFSQGISAPELIRVTSLWCTRNERAAAAADANDDDRDGVDNSDPASGCESVGWSRAAASPDSTHRPEHESPTAGPVASRAATVRVGFGLGCGSGVCLVS